MPGPHPPSQQNEERVKKGSHIDPIVVFDLKDNDILLGRGNGVNYRLGNIRLRELCHPRSIEFHNSKSRLKKYQIIQDILEGLAKTDSRFLRPISMNDPNGEEIRAWEIVGMSTAVSKVKQVLRDRALIIKANGNDMSKGKPRKTANYDRNPSSQSSPTVGRSSSRQVTYTSNTGNGGTNLRNNKNKNNIPQQNRADERDMLLSSRTLQDERIDPQQPEQQQYRSNTNETAGRSSLPQAAQDESNNMSKSAIFANLMLRHGIRSAFPVPRAYRRSDQVMNTAAGSIAAAAPSLPPRRRSFHNDDQHEEETVLLNSNNGSRKRRIRDSAADDESAAWIDSLIEESQKESRLLLASYLTGRCNQHVRGGPTGGGGFYE